MTRKRRLPTDTTHDIGPTLLGDLRSKQIPDAAFVKIETEPDGLDPYFTGKPMTREEIAHHATIVANHYLHGDTGTRGPAHSSVADVKLISMVELAMCRAAGVPWETKLRRKVRL